MGGRADLPDLGGRPLHLLRHQVTAAISPRAARRELGPALEDLWSRTTPSTAGASSRTPPSARASRRSRPGGPPHAPPGHQRGVEGQAPLHHPADKTQSESPDLVNRNFTASRPDELWVADFTYCSTWSGVVYVAYVLDVFSRRVVGWKASRSMTADLVVAALDMAAWTSRHTTLDGLICHTDAGSQYTSVSYTDRIADVDAAPRSGRSATATTTRWPSR